MFPLLSSMSSLIFLQYLFCLCVQFKKLLFLSWVLLSQNQSPGCEAIFSVQFLHFYLVIFFQRIECISCQKYEDQIFISSMPMFVCVWVCDFYLLLSFVVCFHFFFLSLYECQNSYFLTTYYQMSWILQDKLFGWIRKLRGGGGMEAYYLHGLWNQRTVTVCNAIKTDSFTQIQPLYFFKPNHINEGFF